MLVGTKVNFRALLLKQQRQLMPSAKGSQSMFEVIYRYDPDRPRPQQVPADAEEACRCLMDGNRLFASLASDATGSRVVPIDLEDIGIAEPGTVPKQQPFAVVLGCSDARVPTELIFDRNCNELFVVRVAGNVLGQEQLGSIDYAIENLGSNLKVIVVLGHSQCGAVTAAVDAFLTPAEYLGLSSSHHVRAIVNTLFPAVRAAARALAVKWGVTAADLPGFRAALIECSVIMNAALMASILKSEFGDPAGDRRIVFGIYDLGTRCVHVPLSTESRHEPAILLLEAPMGAEEFREFAMRVVGSTFIHKLLGR
jgi:carbonic anhydrase